MSKYSIALVFLLFATLIAWNIYVTITITEQRKVERELQLKLDVCEGDNMVIKDELITSQDSLRILNKVIADRFSE